MPLRVETGRPAVAIAEVPAFAGTEHRQLGQFQQPAVSLQHGRLAGVQFDFSVKRGVQVADHPRCAPVEDRGAAVAALGCVLPHLLAGIEHEPGVIEKQGEGKRRIRPRGRAEELAGSQAQFVVVLKEIQHAGLHVAEELPVPGKALGSSAIAADPVQRVVETALVVKQVEARVEIAPVVLLPIDLGHEHKSGEVCLHSLYEPAEFLGAHELHHVAAETVHAQ